MVLITAFCTTLVLLFKSLMAATGTFLAAAVFTVILALVISAITHAIWDSAKERFYYGKA